MMGLVFCFLTNSLFFLLCSGVWYLVSNLAKVLTILEMKVVSLLFTTVLTLSCFLSSNVRDIRAGKVLEDKAGSRPEFGNALDTEVDALIDASKDAEALEVTSCEAQKVQFRIEG